MKTLLIALSLFSMHTIASASSSEALHRLYDCKSLSDGDYANIAIYQINNSLVGVIEQEAMRGDFFGKDIIELRVAGSSSDFISFEQVEGSRPVELALVKKPTHVTEGFHMQVNKRDGSAVMHAGVGPTDDSIHDERLICSAN